MAILKGDEKEGSRHRVNALLAFTGLGEADRAYVSDWKPRRADYYRHDTRPGERTLILEGHQRTLGLSPDSRHFLYWKEGNVWDYEIAANRHTNLTASAPVSFVNREYDYFGEKPPYGVAGWSKDGKSVLLYHRYDIYGQGRYATDPYTDFERYWQQSALHRLTRPGGRSGSGDRRGCRTARRRVRVPVAGQSDRPGHWPCQHHRCGEQE